MPEKTWPERKIKDLFSNNIFIGDVVRYTAILEFELECLLTQYFICEDRVHEGLNLLITSLTFNNKVETFAKLPVRKSVTSFHIAVVGLRRFRRIRNIAAHSWTITFQDVKKIAL